MDTELQAHIAGLLCAGIGSRLVNSLVGMGEVELVGKDYRFTRDGEPFEKSLSYIVPPDPGVPGDKGVVVLDLSVKDMLLIPTIQTIRFLTNQNSNIPKRYGSSIKRNEFLRRLGLKEINGPDVAPIVTCEYIEQPPKSDTYPFYGTAWAFHLVSEGVVLGENELMIITETDSAFANEHGISIPGSMLVALQYNRRAATASLNVAPLTDDVTRKNGLGMVLMEAEGEEYYFRHVIESQDHADLSEALTTNLLHGKNTTRIVANADMLAINEVTVKTPPRAANNNEYQATDTYNDYGHRYPLLAYVSPKDVVWQDMGNVAGLLEMRKQLSGLANAKHPVWHAVSFVAQA